MIPMSFLAAHLDEPKRAECIRQSLRHVVSESHGSDRLETLQRLVEAAITYLPRQALEDAATELLSSIANQRRDELVRDLIALIPLSAHLGGSAALVAQGETLLNVARWFP